jgi:uncharacterized protein
MSLLSWLLGFGGLLAHDAAPAPPLPRAPEPERRRGLTDAAVSEAVGGISTVPFQLYTTSHATADSLQRMFKPAPAPPGVPALAMDENGWAGQWGGFAGYTENMYWLGFPYLAELTQRPEYRRISETTAREMTRRWFKLQTVGEDDKSDKITALNAAIDKHELKGKFRRLAELDGFFGRAHLYIDTGSTNDREILKAPLIVDARVIGKGCLKALHVIEPQWIYPALYNSTEPLEADYYVPATWFVMGKEVHRSRLLTFIAREMADMFKPSYAFGGLSLSQMAKPYIDNWLRTRQSVSDLVHSFSVPVLGTNMGAILNSGAAGDFRRRAQLFNGMRDNNNLMMIDKTTEAFENVSTPLGSLDRLQAQSQEHIASVAGMPLVILLGITPTGLNPSSEGELQAWAQFVHAAQTNFFDRHLRTILRVLQLDLFGEIDPDITHAWEPLEELNEKERNEANKQEADTDVLYVNAGVLGPDEVRQKLANEPDSPYQGLDLDSPAPGPPDQEEDPLGGPGQQSAPYEPGAQPKTPQAPTLGGPKRGDQPPPASTLIPPLQDEGAEGGREGDHTILRPGENDETHIRLGPRDRMHFQVGQPHAGGRVTAEHTIIKPSEGDVAHVHLGPRDRAHIKLGADQMPSRAHVEDLISGLQDLLAYGNWWEDTREAEDNAEFEDKHPRGEGGKFGKGGGGAGKAKEGKETKGEAPKAPSGAPGPAAAAPKAAGSTAPGAAKPKREPTPTEKQIVAAGKDAPPVAAKLLPTPPPEMSEAERCDLGDQIAQRMGAGELVAQARAKVDAAKAAGKTGSVDDPNVFDKATGKFTPERQREHERIIRKLYPPEVLAAAAPPEGQKPTMTLLGGRGGSGKSWLTKKGPVDAAHAMVIDSDEFKQNLPGYEGWNAYYFHEECDALIDMARDMATKLGLNVVHDGTLKSPSGATQLVGHYKDQGYDIEGHYMFCPPDVATGRAMQRYGRGGETGRFVPPEVILENRLNERNFDMLKSQFKNWSVYDNTVEQKGVEPKLVAKSGA